MPNYSYYQRWTELGCKGCKFARDDAIVECPTRTGWCHYYEPRHRRIGEGGMCLSRLSTQKENYGKEEE